MDDSGRLECPVERIDRSVIVIVIVNSNFLKCHLQAKHRAPAYSRALRRAIRDCLEDDELCFGRAEAEEVARHPLRG